MEDTQQVLFRHWSLVATESLEKAHEPGKFSCVRSFEKVECLLFCSLSVERTPRKSGAHCGRHTTSSVVERESSVSMIHPTPASTALQAHHRLFGFQPQTLHATRVATSTTRSREKLTAKLFRPSWKRKILALQDWEKEKSVFHRERDVKC